MKTTALLGLFAPVLLIGTVACAAITGSDTISIGNTPYKINVSVTGSAAHVTSVAVCVNYSTTEGTQGVCDHPGADPNKPSGIAVGTTGELNALSNPGVSYTIVVPVNQPASTYCSVTSGGAGVFGTATPTAVVTCT
jgi:hypothetical protein